MTARELLIKWFDCWEAGDIDELPIADAFRHQSPYGVIDGKAAYMALINENKEQFLNHRFILHDIVSEDGRACVRYTAVQGSFRMEVTEWHYVENDLIVEVFSYYDIKERRVEYPK